MMSALCRPGRRSAVTAITKCAFAEGDGRFVCRRTDAPLMDWAPIFTRTLLVVGLEFTAKWAPMETGATPMKSLVIAVLALGALAMPAHAQALKYLNINGNLFDVSAEPSVAAPRTTPAPKAKAKAVHHVKKRTAHKGSPT
jgi:hypothetical protein